MIYFFQSEENKRIKIGESDRPLERLSQIDTGSSEHLTVLAILPGGKFREAELHSKFAKYRVKGEWFKASQEILDFIQAQVGVAGEEIYQCIVCGMWLVPNPTEKDVKMHCDYHLSIRKGMIPYPIREFMKKVAWSMLIKDVDGTNVSTSSLSKDDAKRVLVFSWWSRARENDLPDKDLEDYMLDMHDFLDAKISGDKEKYQKINQVINERWDKYG